MLKYYLELLNYNNIPNFLLRYLFVPSLLRLKKVGYFCGMDYASKDIYDFSEYISRFDHSLTVALLTYKLTSDKTKTLAALFHDIGTPCFSHVIDYMNKDYSRQESTEEYTGYIIKNDKHLLHLLKEDNIDIEDIINFKKYSIVDNDRPKLCVDRLDGIILTGIGWTKNITKKDIKEIIDDICIYTNEYGEEEIGFKSMSVAKRVIEISDSIDKYCHSNEDNYMMDLLSKITKIAIDKNYIKYEDLYKYNEKELFYILNSICDKNLINLLELFISIKKEDIEEVDIPNIKSRIIKPLVQTKRTI